MLLPSITSGTSYKNTYQQTYNLLVLDANFGGKNNNSIEFNSLL